jgi:hypothetical protein
MMTQLVGERVSVRRIELEKLGQDHGGGTSRLLRGFGGGDLVSLPFVVADHS